MAEFSEKVFKHKMYIFIFSSSLSGNFLILRRRGEILLSQMYLRLQVKYPSVFPDCNKTWIVSKHFQKEPKCKFSKKIRSFGFKLFHAAGQMDARTNRSDKANIFFLQFANARSKNQFLNIPFFLTV